MSSMAFKHSLDLVNRDNSIATALHQLFVAMINELAAALETIFRTPATSVVLREVAGLREMFATVDIVSAIRELLHAASTLYNNLLPIVSDNEQLLKHLQRHDLNKSSRSFLIPV
jgi:hypothetical protein